MQNILAVDDDPEILKIICDILRDAGYEVDCAFNGPVAIEQLNKEFYDLVITDLNMPEVDGMGVLQFVVDHCPKTVCIILTGYGTIKGCVEAIKIGAFDYVTKPIKSHDLLILVERALESKELEKECYSLDRLVGLLTDRNVRLRKQIEELSQRPQDAEEIRDRDLYAKVCGFISHSIKGEFMHIANAVRGLRQLIGKAPALAEECDMIERSVGYGQVLLRRLLDYFDIGTARKELVDISELLNRLETLIIPRLPSNIRFENAGIGSKKMGMVCVDIEQLIGVLLELVQNAISALRHEGGIIRISVQQRKSEISIFVTDNGPGIDPVLRKILFREQVHSKTGMGLGLYLANKAVSGFGGKLSLATSSQRGTTFKIQLPTVED